MALTEHRRIYNKLYLRLWRKRNPDKGKAYDLKWRLANPEKAKICDAEKGKRWYTKHYHSRPELRAAASARARKWQLADPERNRLNQIKVSHTRRARKLKATVGKIDFELALINSCGICGICGKQLQDSRIEFDHIIPLARSGSHTQDNIQVAHTACNRSKGARIL